MHTKGTKLLAGLVVLLLLYGHTASSLCAQPDYARWGRIAVQETIKRYQASVLDYLHIGRQEVSPTVAEERFKLWVKQGTREFGLLVTVQFNPQTNELLAINFKESPS